MRTSFGPILGLFTLFAVAPAFAEDTAPPEALTVSGNVNVVSDYRFRGISQTDKETALQGGITLTHKSGFYAGVWGSSIAAYVSQGAAQEIDLSAGYKKTVGGVTLDAGAVFYLYPKSTAGNTDYIEPYASASYTYGPVTGKVTVNYAPKQRALALDQVAPRRDNVYLGGDLSGTIPSTPVSVAAHVGHSWGPSYLVPVGKGYTDWSLGATYIWKKLSFGVSYVDTDTTYTTPSGRDAAKGGVVITVGASF